MIRSAAPASSVTVAVNTKKPAHRSPGAQAPKATIVAASRTVMPASHLKLGAHDIVSAKLTSAVRDRQVVTVQRVTYKYSVVRQGVPFDVIRQDDPNRDAGSRAVLTTGRNGVRQVTYQLRYVDGKLVSRVVYRNQVVQAPVSQRTAVGTRQTGPVPAGTAQQIAAGMVSARGWGGDQFSCLVSLWNKESGWRTNAANAYNAGLKGRYLEDQIDDDHLLIGATYPVPRLRDGSIVLEEMPAITALNVRLRDDYVKDATSGVERWWNRIIARAGYAYRLKLPQIAFHRHIGEFAGVHADPDGNLLSDAGWQRRREEFLPSRDDDAYVASLLRPCTEPGAFAPWIAPPRAGVDGKPGNFEYVKLRG